LLAKKNQLNFKFEKIEDKYKNEP